MMPNRTSEKNQNKMAIFTKTLYKKDSKGKIRVLILEVDWSNITESSGLLDGKLVVKKKTVMEGKNIGRANATTPAMQAEAETLSKIAHKKDKGYFDTVDEAMGTEVYLPMLAHTFTKRKHNIVYPAYVQPKLDGVRCLCKKISEFEIQFMSRGGKNYDTMQKHPIREKLIKAMEIGEIYDGEIYHHGWSLQRITSAVKKKKPDTNLLEYWIYDRPSDDGFKDRYNTHEFPDGITTVSTYKIDSEKEVYKYHNQFVQEGYEGVIIRNCSGAYKFGSRSSDLQKYKKFIDDEFEITGYESERQNINGKDYDAIVYVCKTKSGSEFKCRPRGSLDSRSELLLVGDTFVGKFLTVRYQSLTDNTQGDGRAVPQFPVGIAVRDYE